MCPKLGAADFSLRRSGQKNETRSRHLPTLPRFISAASAKPRSGGGDNNTFCNVAFAHGQTTSGPEKVGLLHAIAHLSRLGESSLTLLLKAHLDSHSIGPSPIIGYWIQRDADQKRTSEAKHVQEALKDPVNIACSTWCSSWHMG